ncbi:MAG: 2-amino-4-hydroxy-6-hydroxymethyldihydropteridine diphosphokinase [Pseudomonadota bacterium]
MPLLVALGSNAPPAGQTAEDVVSKAFEAMAAEGLHVVRKSALYRTPCFPAGAGPDYVNAAAVLHSEQPAAAVMAVLHRIEDRFGRERVQRWGMRVLDLDLLADGDAISPDRTTFEAWRALPLDQQKTAAPDVLILPHPRLHERAFVLVPLAEVAPDWRHPVLGQSVAEMLAALPAADRHAVTPV